MRGTALKTLGQPARQQAEGSLRQAQAAVDAIERQLWAMQEVVIEARRVADAPKWDWLRAQADAHVDREGVHMAMSRPSTHRPPGGQVTRQAEGAINVWRSVAEQRAQSRHRDKTGR